MTQPTDPSLRLACSGIANSSFLRLVRTMSICVIFASIEGDVAIAATNQSISVSLFGQTCQLSGPFESRILKTIHSISPEQMPRPQSLTEATQQQRKMRNLAGLPAAFQKYTQKTEKQLTVIQEIFGAYEEAKANRRADRLLEFGKSRLTPRALAELQSWSKKLEGKGPLPSLSADSLYLWFESAIGPTVEEEFHATLRKLKVDYQCSFEDSDSEASDSGE